MGASMPQAACPERGGALGGRGTGFVVVVPVANFTSSRGSESKSVGPRWTEEFLGKFLVVIPRTLEP